MRSFLRSFLPAAALFGVLAASARMSADTVVYLERGSQWRFLPGLAEASSPDAAAWRQPGFDDSAWQVGPAPFGFSDGPFGTDLSLLDPPMRSNYSSLFLRATIQVPQPNDVTEIRALVDYDDGFVMWINGQEALRVNVDGAAGDPLTFDGLASGNRESGTYEEVTVLDARPMLVPGENVIAVHAFNASRTGSDFKIDVEVFDPFGPDQTPPLIARLLPAKSTSIRELDAIEVTFDEPVTGVDAADLLVDGAGATSVTGSAAGPYVFRFPPRPPGPVAVTWRSEHGITDIATARNAFEAVSWDYTVDPNAPEFDVVINEFVAANRGGLTDEDGDEEDWIEIYNRGGNAADLTGWGLTDDPDDLGKWLFPSIVLDPQAYLIVFASGKDRADPGSELHTSFSLSSAGEYLALSSPEFPRRVAMAYGEGYPVQRPAVSYGLDAQGDQVYFADVTPGDANGEGVSFAGIVATPAFSPDHGFFDAPTTVTISTSTPGAEIRYTLDGSEPDTETSPVYESPIDISGTPERAVTVIRAAAFRDGYLASDSATSTYVFVEHVVSQPRFPEGWPRSWTRHPAADYEMDPQVTQDPQYSQAVLDGLLSIPSMSIATDFDNLFGARGIYVNSESEGVAWERPASAEYLPADGRQGFRINCGLRIQGGASRVPDKQAKHSFRLLFKGAYGPTRLTYPLFSDSPVDSFDTVILRGSFNNSWMHWNGGQRGRAQYVRDQFARDTQRDMGNPTARGDYVHVYVNGLYWGLYNLTERPSGPFAASHLGGEKEEYDAYNSAVPVDGTSNTWAQLLQMARQPLTVPATYNALAEFLDLPSFMDYMMINVYGNNADWPHHNWYGARRRLDGAKFHFFCWDSERIMEGVNDSNELDASDGNSPGEIWQRLRTSPEFRLQFADRVQKHMFNDGALTPEAIEARWETRARQIENAVVAESARWGDYRLEVHRWQDPPFEFYRRHTHWQPERERLLATYMPRRTAVLLNLLKQRGLYPRIDAPLFSRHGGEIQPGFSLELSVPDGSSGEIWFTTDNSDPRTPWTGETSATAQQYTGPLVLDDHTHVRARLRDGATWSALEEATFTLPLDLSGLRITEIMYNPLEGGDVEFIELHNGAATTVELGGMRFTNGIELAFPSNSPIRAGEHLVFVANPTAFALRYPGVRIAGTFMGNLDNTGEKLTLKDAAGATVLSVDYNDARMWPIGADGFGYSLVLEDENLDPDDPFAWRESAEIGGSPGAADPSRQHGGIVVSEVLVLAEAPFEDAIELRNITDAPIDVSGWFLSNSRVDTEALRKFRIPDGTVVPANGHVAFYESQFTTLPDDPASIALSGAGGAVYVASADAAGELTGSIRGAVFRGAETGVPFGIHATSAGVDFTALAGPTFGVASPQSVEEFRQGAGADNAEPRVAAVVINEIHFHPAEGGIEFLELHNRSDSPVSLHDAALDLGWRLNGLLNASHTGDFRFPAGTIVPAGGFLVVAPLDEATFRALVAVPPEALVVGPYGGALDNSGERLELLRPAIIDARVTEVLVDEVRYNDRAPWPLDADGLGASLERRRAGEYGNEPLNWASSRADGGTPGAANSRADVPGGGLQIAGDCNQDGGLNVSDAICLLNGLFLTPLAPPCDGALREGANRELLNVNADAGVDLSDAVYVLDYLFRSGPKPAQGLECLPIVGCPSVCAE